MTTNETKSKKFSNNKVSSEHVVRFADIICAQTDDSPELLINNVNRDSPPIPNRSIAMRRRSGILKRRENTITNPAAPSIILSDEGLTAGRVSPFTNFTLFLAMTIRSAGIIFGDIGTSPLYVVKTIFDSEPNENDVIGAISLIVWSLIVLVCVKYAIFILMADNRGEGGPFALCGLLTGQTSSLRYRTKQFVSIISIIAASLLIGDGVFTPAVSILSALEGLTVVKPSLDSWTVKISVVIIIALFLVQRWGSSRIGICFGPIMILWFVVLASVGIWRITYKPVILKAFDPWEAFNYLIRTKKTGFYQIGSIFLSVTGLEVLYADLGHFGRWPVRFSWFALVFPAVLLNYLGQGALIIVYPHFIDNPFYHAMPDWSLWPILVLSIISSTIASQAIITGSFSLVSQAVAMGFCVPLTVIHTSRSIISHIYVPAANYFLLALILGVTIGFQNSSRITDAYGVTVCSVMVITTILYMMVIHWVWLKPFWLVILFGIFLIVDLYTFAAIYATKIASGGWVAILIAVVVFIFSFSWYYGNICLKSYLSQHCKTNLIEDLPKRIGFEQVNNLRDDQTNSDSNGSSTDDEENDKGRSTIKFSHNRNQNISISFIGNEDSPRTTKDTSKNDPIEIKTAKTAGVGCFLTTSKKYTPYVFENFLNRMNAHQQILIFLKVEYARTPNIDDDQRLLVREFSKNVYHITSIFGYAETNINLLNILHLAKRMYDIPIPNDETNVTFFLPDETIRVNTKGWKTWFKRWPLYIYSVLKNLYPGMPLNFQTVPENTIKIGIMVNL